MVDRLIESVTAARDREGLVGAIRAMDRVLSWGHYVVPLYHLAEDRVAYWEAFGRPALTPTYGAVIETWWARPGPRPPLAAPEWGVGPSSPLIKWLFPALTPR